MTAPVQPTVLGLPLFLPLAEYPHTITINKLDFSGARDAGGQTPGTPVQVYQGPAFVAPMSSEAIADFQRRDIVVSHQICVPPQGDGTLPVVGRNYQIVFGSVKMDVKEFKDLANIGIQLVLFAEQLVGR